MPLIRSDLLLLTWRVTRRFSACSLYLTALYVTNSACLTSHLLSRPSIHLIGVTQPPYIWLSLVGAPGKHPYH
ncbi:unnamed protein product [Staurois parvus]|uniref:Secreted protein n=1 Tax=Staurois parvus TaxID=386267 RepID=A0ABN9CVS1_9NEOB|nr:unnamed protein product [Staurois parvus]